jgi:hypothetical protein
MRAVGQGTLRGGDLFPLHQAAFLQTGEKEAQRGAALIVVRARLPGREAGRCARVGLAKLGAALAVHEAELPIGDAGRDARAVLTALRAALAVLLAELSVGGAGRRAGPALTASSRSRSNPVRRGDPRDGQGYARSVLVCYASCSAHCAIRRARSAAPACEISAALRVELSWQTLYARERW